MLGAALVAVGAIAAFAIKGTPQPEPVRPDEDIPLVVAACGAASCWCARPGADEDVSLPHVPVPVPAILHEVADR